MRHFQLLLAVALGASSVACEQRRAPQPEPVPEWVQQTQIDAHETRRVFENNVELSVSITNTAAAPVIVQHMDRHRRVKLKSSDGTMVSLHPLSIGVAKPILLQPGERKQTSLLFSPLSGDAAALEVYGEASPLTHTAGSFTAGAR